MLTDKFLCDLAVCISVGCGDLQRHVDDVPLARDNNLHHHHEQQGQHLVDLNTRMVYPPRIFIGPMYMLAYIIIQS